MKTLTPFPEDMANRAKMLAESLSPEDAARLLSDVQSDVAQFSAAREGALKTGTQLEADLAEAELRVHALLQADESAVHASDVLKAERKITES